MQKREERKEERRLRSVWPDELFPETKGIVNSTVDHFQIKHSHSVMKIETNSSKSKSVVRKNHSCRATCYHYHQRWDNDRNYSMGAPTHTHAHTLAFCCCCFYVYSEKKSKHGFIILREIVSMWRRYDVVPLQFLTEMFYTIKTCS